MHKLKEARTGVHTPTKCSLSHTHIHTHTSTHTHTQALTFTSLLHSSQSFIVSLPSSFYPSQYIYLTLNPFLSLSLALTHTLSLSHRNLSRQKKQLYPPCPQLSVPKQQISPTQTPTLFFSPAPFRHRLNGRGIHSKICATKRGVGVEWGKLVFQCAGEGALSLVQLSINFKLSCLKRTK